MQQEILYVGATVAALAVVALAVRIFTGKPGDGRKRKGLGDWG
jgi:hypothetical protein